EGAGSVHWTTVQNCLGFRVNDYDLTSLGNTQCLSSELCVDDQNVDVKTESVAKLGDFFVVILWRGVNVDEADTKVIVFGRENFVFTEQALRCTAGIRLAKEYYSVLIGILGHLMCYTGFINQAEIANS